MAQSMVTLLAACIGAAVPLLAHLEQRRRRRRGRLMTRRSDRESVDRDGDRLWIGQELDERSSPPNGHGDLPG